ncbi:cytochrome B6 [Aquabacterium sp. A7-Y]|uniref:cytochrome-c peroxidase n=1 Tax=Aquabacterium sp. A7-Y TaxID=1349605 RepID=UPI00223CD161|nr:cytochrome c peroxidase [Aquabacterium sp. A7-Y]MCW7541067.1 cytochrome B6 [Aquabacterium sp. A7-Y]
MKATIRSSTAVKALVVVAVSILSGAAWGQLSEPISPLPLAPAADPRKVELGSKLFRDTRFASDNSVSCLSCHSFQHGGADPRPFSVGAKGAVHIFNTPTVLNSGLNIRQQWTGGAASLEELTNLVVKSPRVFNSSWEQVIGKLSQDAPLVQGFKAAYSDGMTAKNIADALAVYQRSLMTPARFDRYLRGDANAITPVEKLGYEKFKAYGCVGCHQGSNVGGNMFQRFGAVGDYFAARAAAGRPITDADRGRYNVTKNPEDLHVFKVPSLRNVALTAPYFHDGSAKTLEEAVDVMFRYQLGRTAAKADREAIVKFLGSLSGEAQKP